MFTDPRYYRFMISIVCKTVIFLVLAIATCRARAETVYDNRWHLFGYTYYGNPGRMEEMGDLLDLAGSVRRVTHVDLILYVLGGGRKPFDVVVRLRRYDEFFQVPGEEIAASLLRGVRYFGESKVLVGAEFPSVEVPDRLVVSAEVTHGDQRNYYRVCGYNMPTVGYSDPDFMFIFIVSRINENRNAGWNRHYYPRFSNIGMAVTALP